MTTMAGDEDGNDDSQDWADPDGSGEGTTKGDDDGVVGDRLGVMRRMRPW